MEAQIVTIDSKTHLQHFPLPAIPVVRFDLLWEVVSRLTVPDEIAVIHMKLRDRVIPLWTSMMPRIPALICKFDLLQLGRGRGVDWGEVVYTPVPVATADLTGISESSRYASLLALQTKNEEQRNLIAALKQEREARQDRDLAAGLAELTEAALAEATRKHQDAEAALEKTQNAYELLELAVESLLKEQKNSELMVTVAQAPAP